MPLTDASAINVAKLLIDIMTKHAYLPTTLITDKGTAFTSTIIAQITQILRITLKLPTTKHPQTIGKLERTHASLKTNLKLACGEYRRQWHKYLPLAVLNHNTSYHASIGCEPTRVFHGRVAYNILDHKLGKNPNDQITPTTEFAEEVQNRTKLLLDKTKQNTMQSYIKYKEYYDRKAKAAPLKKMTRKRRKNCHSARRFLHNNVGEELRRRGNEPIPPIENQAQTSPKKRDDIIVPEISHNYDRNENLSPRGGQNNLRLNPNPNYSEDSRY